MGAEIVVLGTFTPSEWTTDTIEREFRALPFIPACCKRERIGVRIPQDKSNTEPPDANLQWHQDGGGIEGTTHHMVVWANDMPTHLKSSSGEFFQAPNSTVVWYDNTKAFHKQPEGTGASDRWFVAIRCSGALA